VLGYVICYILSIIILFRFLPFFKVEKLFFKVEKLFGWLNNHFGCFKFEQGSFMDFKNVLLFYMACGHKDLYLSHFVKCMTLNKLSCSTIPGGNGGPLEGPVY
jgi:hypothetical protein